MHQLQLRTSHRFQSKTGRILKQCHLCRHDKRVLESPHGQEAVSPPSKRNRNYTSPTKASLACSIDRQAPAEATLRTSALAPPPKFLLRGKDSQDDAETAAARKEQNNIRRRHRLANRRHEEHSPTPSLNTLVSASRVGAALESPRLRPLAAAPGPATCAISPAMSGSPAPSPVPRLATLLPAISRSPAPSLVHRFAESTASPDHFLEERPRPISPSGRPPL